MSNIIVVGCGRVGSRLALMLSNYENNVCVIDRDPRAFALGKQVEPAVNPYFFARRRKGNLPLAQTAVA